MLRVPGSETDLFGVKSRGGDVRIVYSPLDAVKLAQENPDREVVFFGIGFETTAPANAMSVWMAAKKNANSRKITTTAPAYTTTVATPRK